MWDYTDALRDHFFNPRNVGSIPDANAIGEVGSLACGDALKLYLKIDDNGRIEDARFQTFGCASAIASSSALTELIKGKTVEEALAVSNKEIADFLGGLPREKMHCSVMGQEALEAAIRNWRGISSLPGKEGRIICKCFGVTDTTVSRAVKENGLHALEDVVNYTKAGGACGQCRGELQAVLDETLGRMQIKPLEQKIKPGRGLTNLQRVQLVLKVLDEDIKPYLRQDGGDIELIDVDGKTVYIELLHACKQCPSGRQTLKGFVEKTLREKVEQDLIVEEVSQ